MINSSKILRSMYNSGENMYNCVRNLSSASEKILRLEGKVAVVTASTAGIGYAIAERLASEGASVVISSRKAEMVAAAVENLRKKKFNVEGIVCHVGKADHRKRLLETAVQKFGGLDILVSNAAVNPVVGNAVEADDEVWDKVFDINVKVAWQLTKEATPLMRKRNGGAILFVSSIAAYDPFPLLGLYSISKSALLGLTRILAADVAPDNIRVNCLAPGIVDTRFSESITSSPESLEVATNATLLKRLGTATEIAAAAAFLVSDDASYITAETLVAAGGHRSHL